MLHLSFTVFGQAKPGGSKKAFKHPHTDRIVVTDDSGKEGKAWRSAVVDAARAAYRGPLLDGPLALELTFYKVRPKSHYRTGRNSHLLRGSAPERPTTRPDVLKLARAVEDALTEVVWRDDALIVDEVLSKRFGEPARCEVVIRELAPTPSGDDEQVALLPQAA